MKTFAVAIITILHITTLIALAVFGECGSHVIRSQHSEQNIRVDNVTNIKTKKFKNKFKDYIHMLFFCSTFFIFK